MSKGLKDQTEIQSWSVIIDMPGKIHLKLKEKKKPTKLLHFLFYSKYVGFPPLCLTLFLTGALILFSLYQPNETNPHGVKYD